VLVSVEVAGAAAHPNTPRMLYVKALGGGTVVSLDGRINCGTRCSASYRPGTLVTLRASGGGYFSFEHWRQDCVGTAPRCIVALDRKTSVTAVFTPHRGSVSLTVGGGGKVVSDPDGLACGDGAGACFASFANGTTLNLHPVLAANSVFDRWDGACRSAPASGCTFRVLGDSEASAAFRKDVPSSGPQTLRANVIGSTVSSEPAGISCPTTCEASFPSGTPVTLRGSGTYIWTGACVGLGGACALVVDGPTDVGAQMPPPAPPPPPPPPRRSYGINVSVAGKGVVSGGGKIHCGSQRGTLLDCEGEFRRGAEVVLRATAVGRSRFVRWSGFCQGKRPRCSVRVTAPKIVTALFRR